MEEYIKEIMKMKKGTTESDYSTLKKGMNNRINTKTEMITRKDGLINNEHKIKKDENKIKRKNEWLV
jgi:hypothetical protein